MSVIPACTAQQSVERGRVRAANTDHHQRTLMSGVTNDNSHTEQSSASSPHHQQLATFTGPRANDDRKPQASCHLDSGEQQSYSSPVKVETAETVTASCTSQFRHESDMCLDFTDLFELILPQSTSSSAAAAAAVVPAVTGARLPSDQLTLNVDKCSSHKFLLLNELFDFENDQQGIMSSCPDIDCSIQFALEAIKSHS